MFEILMMLTFIMGVMTGTLGTGIVVWRCFGSILSGAVPEPEKTGRLGDIHIIRELKNGVYHRRNCHHVSRSRKSTTVMRPCANCAHFWPSFK